jgi:hypothetical protein
MEALKSGGWDFIVKGIEFLDAQLGLDYISTPMPLLWKITRESQHCCVHAMKLMTLRLLKVAFLILELIIAKCAFICT